MAFGLYFTVIAGLQNDYSLGSSGIFPAGNGLLVSLLSGCDTGQAKNAPPPPPDVSVADVLVKPVSQWDSFNGRVEAVESVQLRPRVSGYINSVNYHEGDEVRKGQVLFTIDDRSYRAALEQAKATLARARSQASLTRSESARTEKLVGTQAVSREMWEQRRSTASQVRLMFWPPNPLLTWLNSIWISPGSPRRLTDGPAGP